MNSRHRLNSGISSRRPDARPDAAVPRGKVKGRVAPATGGDLFLQITSGRHDLNFELATGLARRLQPFATLAEEIHGFRYLDSRDLTGLITGPKTPGERPGRRRTDRRRGPAIRGRQLRRGPALRPRLERWRR